jgi:phosphate transport system substrate-binding protein
LAEIRDIYAGKKTTWSNGNKIFLVIRPAADAYTDFLVKLSPGMKSVVETAQKRPGIFIGITDQDAADQIERTPGSFGVTSYTLVASEKRKIKPLAVDGISPVGKKDVNDKYPYLMNFYLVYLEDRNTGAVRNFYYFIDSKEGVKILRRNGHIPIGKAQGNL